MKVNYKTAIKRIRTSAPVQYLIDNNLLHGKKLDYGCGQGFDADVIGADKYDPYYFPEELHILNNNVKMVNKYDTIVCNYVINVIEDIADITALLTTIQAYLAPDGVAYISVRRDLQAAKEGSTVKGFQATVELGLEIVENRKGKFQMYKLTTLTDISKVPIERPNIINSCLIVE